jgi:hypothetical protein
MPAVHGDAGILADLRAIVDTFDSVYSPHRGRDHSTVEQIVSLLQTRRLIASECRLPVERHFLQRPQPAAIDPRAILLITVPDEEWPVECDREQIARMLHESARVVREAVKGRVLARRDMDLNYDDPILLLQLLLWHEGYHHGQIELALKLAGRPDWRRRGRSAHVGRVETQTNGV